MPEYRDKSQKSIKYIELPPKTKRPCKTARVHHTLPYMTIKCHQVSKNKYLTEYKVPQNTMRYNTQPQITAYKRRLLVKFSDDTPGEPASAALKKQNLSRLNTVLRSTTNEVWATPEGHSDKQIVIVSI